MAHATPADLSLWLDPSGGTEPVAAHQLHLRLASTLVDDAVRLTRFDPASPRVLAAQRDATCAHAAALLASGVDPTAGGTTASATDATTSLSLGPASIGFATAEVEHAAAVRASVTTRLCDEARLVLRNAGLLSPHVRTAW